MPRYFLHVRNRDNLLQDPDGQELPDLKAAIEEAGAAARDLMSDGLRAGLPLGLHREMVIEDGQGTTLTALSFAEALPADQ